jgi:hypothetical protein
MPAAIVEPSPASAYCKSPVKGRQPLSRCQSGGGGGGDGDTTRARPLDTDMSKLTIIQFQRR